VRAVLLSALLLLPLAAVAGGCEDPFLGEVVLAADSFTLAAPTSASELPSAIDIGGQVPSLRRPELSTEAQSWDFQLRQSGAGLVLFPFAGGGSFRGAGIRETNEDFDDAGEAPRGRDEYEHTAVALREGGTYFLQSREVPPFACVKYGILEVIDLDAAAGTAEVTVRSNTGCDDERLRRD
jgi:hypothetical protein